jgi:PIF1-like helicase/Helix-turn-helix domain/HRDC domain
VTFQTNPQLDIAFDYVRNTHKNIFLTGKAGTGKTTFLHQIKKESLKRMVVVAPTGVAAINAGGMTIHSFFQLPFGPILPDTQQDTASQRKFNSEKIHLIRSLELLVIDEISMVRADLLDGIDVVLRRYKDYSKPFGGVQLLMIGDLHQLPPVVKDEEWTLLRPYYDTAYFFGSAALKLTDPVSIELKHIYRQSDEIFINLLNKVRDNKMDAEVLALLNSRYIANFQPPKDESYITLTAHNAAAQTINAEKLAELKTPSQFFKATVTGDFPPFSYPTDDNLELKIGSQVMFVKNDISREKLFFNGKLGTVTKLGKDVIHVLCPGETMEIITSPLEWSNAKYNLNAETKEITEDKIGSFTQFPLKLAWAITIHKSQGLTFERAIIDAQAAFAHGQVYVALSRCKTFEGMVLRSKINTSSVKTDPIVQKYSKDADENALDEDRLLASKAAFQQALILDLFDFKITKRAVENAQKVIFGHQNTLQGDVHKQVDALVEQSENEVFLIARRFETPIQAYFKETDLPETNEALQTRIQKAATYFIEKLTPILASFQQIQILTDNKIVRKAAFDALAACSKNFFIKEKVFSAAKINFNAHEFLKLRANAEIDFQMQQALPTANASNIKVPKGIRHPELYRQLVAWRDYVAEQMSAESYMILPYAAIQELAHQMPTTLPALKKIKGIGAAKSGQFGKQILEIVVKYALNNQIDSTQLTIVEPFKKDTKTVSFDLFKSGKTIEEIAEERFLHRSTIEGHLAYFVETGDLDIEKVMSNEAIEAIRATIFSLKSTTMSEIRTALGDKFGFNEIRMVLQKIGETDF